MMGDSTTRQVWSSIVSGFGGNNFERNAKEWTRENVSVVDLCY
jgi:frataxin-like iron-binding protein CyaY